MRLRGRGAADDLVPWDRRYPIPLGGATLGQGGHVEDHNAIALQLPELWAENNRLYRQLDSLRWHLIVLTVIVAILAILLAVTLLT